MSIFFLESFDDGLYDLGKWLALTGDFALDTGRRSTNGLRIRNSANFTGGISVPDQKTVTLGMARNHRVLSSSTEIMMALFRGAEIQLSAYTIGTSGNINIYRGNSGGTLLATATSALSVDGFHHWTFTATIDNTTGSFDLRKDGVTIASATGIDTEANSAADDKVDQIRVFGNTSTATAGLQEIIDDVYVGDTLLGDVQVHALFPDADGDTNQWTPDTGVENFSRVDENPPDDDASYVETTTANETDLYGFEDISASGSVTAVIARAYIKNSGGGTINGRILARRGTTADGTSQELPSVYGVLSETYDQDPVAAAAWTRANLNNTQFGFESL